MAGEKIPEENISWVRGYATAIEDVFNAPEMVLKHLDQAALRAYQRATEEQLSEEAPPYE